MYNVRAEHIAEDVSDEVRALILEFLKTYDFPYVTTIRNKTTLRNAFMEYFKDRHNPEWLKQKVYELAKVEGRPNLRGVAAVAWCETNRLHTMGLGRLLLSRGIRKCTTVHSYGRTHMSSVCQANLE